MPARPLTHRQLEVLELVAKGLTNADIARVLGIGLGTAKHHVSAVIEALDVANRAEAAAALNELELGRRVAPVPRGTGASVPGFGERPALALLPLENLGGDDGDAWFVRGLLGDLTRKTGGLRWFPVIQRDSALAAGDAGAEALNARYHVAGTVLREGDHVCLSLRVVDADSGEHVWADRLERPLHALQEMQQEIVERIAGELEPAVLRV
jgi:adenylate cyclase